MKIYSLNELKESKLIFDRKAPPFGTIITLITLVFVAVALIIAGFSTKTYVVKASGIVSSQDKVNVMNNVSGNIKKIYVNDGDYVNAGDIILDIDTFQIDIQIEQLNSGISFLNNSMNNLYKLNDFIDNFLLSDESSQINPFDNSIDEEKQYYAAAKQFIEYAVTSTGNEEDLEGVTQEDIDSLKTQFISQNYSKIDGLNYELINKQSEKEAYQELLNDYKVVANSDGIIHLSTPVTIGTVLQAGSLIGTISSGKADDVVIETVVSAFDRSRLSINSKVEIALAGVMQTEYGVLTGKITHIDSNSIQTEQGEVYFKIIIKPDKTQLKNKKGNTVNLMNGMIAESRIKYNETTWLKWAIEQIGVKLR
ncbi:MAG: HlyD family efflux transporter periplasmic adaptor subunit [Clostridiales bacterium]|nr:HlyD family efflux transporter periplasmic adaptor subunit [Clostridiales bacterium]